MWTLAFGDRTPTHGYAETREGAMAAFAKSWRRHYNTIRPQASLRYKPPAPEVFVPTFAAWPAALRQPASPDTPAQRPALN